MAPAWPTPPPPARCRRRGTGHWRVGGERRRRSRGRRSGPMCISLPASPSRHPLVARAHRCALGQPHQRPSSPLVHVHYILARHVIGRSIVAEFNASEQGRGQLPKPRTNWSIHSDCTQAIPSRCHLVMAPTPPSTTLILASSPHHLTQQRCPDPPRECGGSTTSTPSFHPPAAPRSSTHRCCPSPHPTPLASPRPPPVTQ